MAYYTILPVHIEQQEVAEYVQLEYNGYQVLACKVEDDYILERLFSSDPMDYTIADLQPGTLLNAKLINKIIK